MTAEERPRPKPPMVATLVTVVVFIVLYLPLVTVVVYSLLAPSSGDGRLTAFTMEWYRKVLSNRSLGESLQVSLIVASLTTLGATTLGTLGALAIERGRFPGRRWFEMLTMFPLVMPEIVLGLALLIWFALIRLSLSWFSIVLAHVTFCLSYVVITVRTRLRDFDQSLEEAAADLGASPWQVFWRVTFPLIWPGILSAALMAFTLSFDDFLIAFFTAGVGSDTLPLRLYALIKYGMNPELYALSSLVLMATFVLMFGLFRLGALKDKVEM